MYVYPSRLSSSGGRSARGGLLALAALALLLAGCHRGAGQGVVAPVVSSQPAVPRDAPADAAVQRANHTMAAGVPIGVSAAPVEARFDLAAVPTPGVPFVVGVALLPGAPVPLLRVEVSASDGLTVLEPEAQASHEKVAAGTVIPLQLRLQSAEVGTRVLMVKVTLELPEGPQARTFAFPLLVSAPAPPATAPVAPPKPR
ncbi:MAG: hypothetical protein WCH32_13810 [Pseudomonadota bacterium]